jgi:hypothetical protein
MRVKVAFVISVLIVLLTVMYVIPRAVVIGDMTYDAFYIEVEEVEAAIVYQFYIEDMVYETPFNRLNVSFLPSGDYDITLFVLRDNKHTLKLEQTLTINHYRYYDVIETLYVIDDVLYVEPKEGMKSYIIYINGEIFETEETSYDLSAFKGELKHIEVKGLYENSEGRYSHSILVLDDVLDTLEVEVDSLNTGVFSYKEEDIKKIEVIGSDVTFTYDDKGLYASYDVFKDLNTLNLYVKVELSESFYYLHIRVKDMLFAYLRTRSDVLYEGEDIRLKFHTPDRFSMTLDGLIQGRDYEILGSDVMIKASYIETHKTGDVLILSYVIRDYHRVTVGYIFIR